jgi:YegS/Rv2252/BmrU family lipid kinase
MTTHPALPEFQIRHHRLPDVRRTAFVIYNHVAGGAKRKAELDLVCARLQGHGWNVATIATRCPGDGTEAARVALSEGADAVLAMGGDGTVNEIVQVLAGSSTPLGLIPVGTVNVLARELGLPLEPLDAVDALATGEPLAIDLGKINGRFFTMMVGLGYDAASAMAMQPEIKKLSGQLAYWVGAVQQFGKHKSVRAKIVLEDGKKKRRLRRLIYMMVVSNTGLYGDGAMKFTPEASVRDGILDICLIRSARWYRALLHIVLTFAGRLKTVQDVEYFQARKVTITTGRPFPYQIDGDPVGHTPVTIEIVPLALHVLVPPRTPAP